MEFEKLEMLSCVLCGNTLVYYYYSLLILLRTTVFMFLFGLCCDMFSPYSAVKIRNPDVHEPRVLLNRKLNVLVREMETEWKYLSRV